MSDKDFSAFIGSQQGGSLQNFGAIRNQMPVSPKPSLAMLDSSLGSLRALSDRLSGLANQLVGVEPEKGGPNGIGTSGGGVFGEVENFAQEIDELVGTMARHLSRIERRL